MNTAKQKVTIAATDRAAGKNENGEAGKMKQRGRQK